MEYVIILVFVGVVLSVASNRLLYGYPNGNEGEGGFGPLGKQLQGFYQRTLGGLSLPVP